MSGYIPEPRLSVGGDRGGAQGEVQARAQGQRGVQSLKGRLLGKESSKMIVSRLGIGQALQMCPECKREEID